MSRVFLGFFLVCFGTCFACESGEEEDSSGIKGTSGEGGLMNVLPAGSGGSTNATSDDGGSSSETEGSGGSSVAAADAGGSTDEDAGSGGSDVTVADADGSTDEIAGSGGSDVTAADAGGSTETAGEGEPSEAGHDGGEYEYSVEIRRTEFGVPHVRALDEKGLGYGVGYAYAEDNVCIIADTIVTVRGERSKYFGPTATYDDFGTDENGQGRIQRSNLVSDFYHKYLNDPERVQASWERQPTEIKDLIQGYVAGVNRYLKDATKAGLPAACKDQPWIRDISALDVIRAIRHYNAFRIGVMFMDALYDAQPPGVTAGMQRRPGVSSTASAQMQIDYWDQFRNEMGSNGIALGKDATESGAGLLLANPHFPWFSSYRFYQLHLTIPGKVDVMGVTFLGFPIVLIGFNRELAWTHTVNTSQHFTFFSLYIDPDDPTRYIVDGQSRPMERKTLTIEVENGTVTRDLYLTDYGPMIAMDLGVLAFDWTNQEAYALRDANFDNDRLIEQWWTMDKAKSMVEFKEAVEGILGIPWVDTLATDKVGNVYFGDITPVPNVPSDKLTACLPPSNLIFQLLAQQGIYVLSGNDSRCNWNEDPTTPQKGIMPASQLPTLSRTDYVQNSNDSAWMTNASQPLVDFPPIVSTDSTQMLLGRTRYGLSQIAARLNGSDGLPGNRFNMSSLQSLVLSNRSLYGGALLNDLKSVCDLGAYVILTDGSIADISKGCSVIKGWDGKAELTSVGYPLFDAWNMAMLASGIDYWDVPFDANDPVNTPRGMRTIDPLVALTARQKVAQAMKTLDDLGLDYTKPLGQIQVAVRGDKRIPIHGGSTIDVYNTMVGSPIGDGQFDVILGSSALFAVSFEGDSPKVQGFLTYSQSTNPASPYYSDQTERFSAKEWIDYPFSDEEIEADPNLSIKELMQ